MLARIGSAGFNGSERYCSNCSGISARQKHAVVRRKEREPGAETDGVIKAGRRGQKARTLVARPMGGVELDNTNDVRVVVPYPYLLRTTDANSQEPKTKPTMDAPRGRKSQSLCASPSLQPSQR